MREITNPEELKQLELEIFDQIHVFCMKRGLRYSLYGGTMIGAIRHKGFIPWDDDIDLIMPRPDYEIFCRTFKADGFSVHDYRNDADYVLPYAKVYHEKTLLQEHARPDVKSCVFVDVFPVDGFPDNKGSLKRARRSRRINMLCVASKIGPLWKHGLSWYKCLILCCMRCVLCMIPPRFFIHRFQEEVKKHGFENMPFVADMTWGYGECQCVPKSAFSSFVDVDFEGRKAKAIVGWDKYLRNVFGDYMELPPREKRVSHHAFKVWVEDSCERKV